MAISNEYEEQIVDYFRHMMGGASVQSETKKRINLVHRNQIIASQFGKKSQFLLYRVPYVNAYCLCCPSFNK